MDITFLDDAWQDYLYWQKTDKKILKRINQLIKDIQRTPFEGIGKPETAKARYVLGFGRVELIKNIA